jgi:hypothetical protein
LDRFIVVKNGGHTDVLYADLGAAAKWLAGFFLHRDTASPVGQ